VRSAVGVGTETACMLTDRLLPDVIDPVSQQKLKASDGISKAAFEARIKELEQMVERTTREKKSALEDKDKKIQDLEILLKKWKVEEIPGGRLMSLPAIWAGRKIQFWNKDCGSMDTGSGSTRVYLYNTPLYAHDNQTFRLETSDNGLTWTLHTNDGSEYFPSPSSAYSRLYANMVFTHLDVLELQSSDIVRSPPIAGSTKQRWNVQKAEDPFSVWYVIS
jgi:hypothetical protein